LAALNTAWRDTEPGWPHHLGDPRAKGEKSGRFWDDPGHSDILNLIEQAT
jgi:hypothetical protein